MSFASRLSTTAILLPALCLTACLGMGGEDSQPKLTGERIDVTLQPQLTVATPGADSEPFILPEATPEPNWGQRGGNAAHLPGNVELPAKVVRAWSYNLGGSSKRGTVLITAPVVHSGRLFAVNTDGEVTALDAKTGKRLWDADLPFAKKTEARITGGLAVLGNLLFITTGDGNVYALTASTGKEAWKVSLGVPLRAAPTADGEMLYVISHDNRLFALNALDGSLAWTHSGMEEPLSLLTSTSPASANGVVAVPYSSGEIYILRASDGRYVWHDTLASAFTGQDPESTVTSIAAPPVIADGLLYTVGLNGGLSAYGIANGQRYWKADVVTSQMPIVAGMQIYVLTEKGDMMALNRKDGGIRWVADLAKGLPDADEGKRYWSGPVLAGGRLIAVSSDGYAVSMEPQTGKRIAATSLDEQTSIPPIVADNGLYFLTDDGKVIAFRAGK
jgi:outer membrane protein assembly factor BamB